MLGGPLRQYFEIPFHLLKANLEQGVSLLNSPQSDQLDYSNWANTSGEAIAHPTLSPGSPYAFERVPIEIDLS
jgi:hypothetical protein